MKYKQSFITNSSTTAYIMIGKSITVEEFKKRVNENDMKHLVAIQKENEYDRYPFRDDREELIEIAKLENPDREYFLYEHSGISTSADWEPEVMSLKKLKDIKDIENYDIIVYGTGGAC